MGHNVGFGYALSAIAKILLCCVSYNAEFGCALWAIAPNQHPQHRTTQQVFHIIKGSVQRKLRWVENGVNRSVGASDCGAGHCFAVLFRFRLGFAIFPFPVSTV
jgi:hypothetical protein